MFKNILRRLTVLNSLVFLLIFVAFTMILYEYMAFRLFDKIDYAMQLQASSFRVPRGAHKPPPKPPQPPDPRIFLLLQSTDGRIIHPGPAKIEEISNMEEFNSLTKPGEIQTKNYEEHIYRTVRIPYSDTDNSFNEVNDFQVQYVIAVSNVDAEVALLNNLLWITLGGGVIGTIAIILAGYFLAKRAMIPIQAAWEKQQQFVSDASHELRSPITGIYTNAALMLKHPENSVEAESYRLHIIIRESMRLKNLISSLLTLARSDANKSELHLELINISAIIDNVLEQFKGMDELNGISLFSDIQPNLALIADKERLHQLFVILLDNALKYTQAGGQVQIHCFQAKKNVVMTVADTGIGIAPNHLHRIFERFFRVDKSRSRESGGIGLGLAIAKWIVEKHGGKINVESELGKGTKFMISMPAYIPNKE
ncbi:MAG: HAMP domain-containing sensor histidine kinase [Sporomusaceae bacterium]|nr:HAMP domain-containing sensor histidine kinase [Sporomusaceae bacterium]